MKIVIIVAMTRNRVIGNAGRVPWHDSEDLKHFKRVTTGHAVIMGRKTFESIGRPLPGRRNIVVTRKSTIANRQSKIEDTSNSARHDASQAALDIAHSLDEALWLCRERNEEEAFIIGGGQIYALALPIADEMIVTRIDHEDISGDTFFPEWDPRQWVVAAPADPTFPRAIRYHRVRP